MTEIDLTHLSDDALDDLLLGGSSAAASAHLATCPTCAARLESIQSPITAFNQASSAWSEARSNTISRELPAPGPRFAFLPAWSIAAAFFLAVALSFLVGIHRGMTPHSTDQAASAIQAGGGAVNRQREIASDNDMLNAIESEISRPVASPLDVYAVARTTPSSGTSIREVRD